MKKNCKRKAGNSQCAKLLDALQQTPGGLTTIAIRDTLDILSPPARIRDLKEFGHNIAIERVQGDTQRGRKHRGISRYVLLPGEAA